MSPFKKKEWQYGITKFILSEMLKNHYKIYIDPRTGWKKEDIWYFLQLHHWTYPDRNPYSHHYRTCEEIILEIAS